MSLLLHISDLHLGKKDPAFDDSKTEVIPINERETRQKSMRRTLRKIAQHLDETGDKLEAVLVTGDITYAGDEQGFRDFENVLSELGEQCPPKRRIAVIPGNHDVIRGTPPSTVERYKFFKKYVRAAGFVTPLLDGIDIGPDVKPLSNLERHCIIDAKNKWFVLPVNSANYSQMVEPTASISEAAWTKFQEQFPDRERKAVRKTLENLRLADAARISVGQFDALEDVLSEITKKLTARGEDPDCYLRVAILHHHLLPVSTIEEIKKFESFTNLGLLRHFLAKHEFDLVLHGHKHIGKLYWDHIPFSPNDPLLQRKVHVISGGTLGEAYHAEDEVCRLIRFKGSEKARRLLVASVPGLPPGDHFKKVTYSVVNCWEAKADQEVGGAPLKRIIGQHVDSAYDRLLAFFEDSGVESHHNVVCQIQDGTSGGKIPYSYPHVDAVEASMRQDWFDRLVDWWQLREPTLSKTLHFTHGDRIYRNVDQIKNVIMLLTQRPLSSRAVVALCRPQNDFVHEHKTKFPSFCLAQFIVRERSGKSPVLDCFGYFRKQEMKYWWPVNVAELARLQRTVCEEIPKSGSCENLGIGTITTYASIARIGKRPPQVSVPIVDRNLDQDPQLLWTMSYALFWPNKSERQRYRKEWEKVLRELVPQGGFDPDGIPIPLAGLKFLVETIERFTLHHSSAPCRKLIKAMKELQERNENFVDTLYKDESEARSMYQQWQNRAAASVEEMKDAIGKLLGK